MCTPTPHIYIYIYDIYIYIFVSLTWSLHPPYIPLYCRLSFQALAEEPGDGLAPSVYKVGLGFRGFGGLGFRGLRFRVLGV